MRYNYTLAMVNDEAIRSDTLHGTFDTKSLERCYTILGEEVGELAEGILELDRAPVSHTKIKHAMTEAIQTAAVATRIAEKLQRMI